MASRTAAIRRSSERVEKFTELRELPGLSGSSERSTSFSITMGDGGPAREARLEELEGMVSLKSNCGEEEKDIVIIIFLDSKAPSPPCFHLEYTNVVRLRQYLAIFYFGFSIWHFKV